MPPDGDEQAGAVGDRCPIAVAVGDPAGPGDAVGAGHHQVAVADVRDGDKQAGAVGDRAPGGPVGPADPVVPGGGPSDGPGDAIGAGHHQFAGAGAGVRDGDEQAGAVGDR